MMNRDGLQELETGYVTPRPQVTCEPRWKRRGVVVDRINCYTSMEIEVTFYL
ncbi:hypothetical protein HanIR_Chr02g0092241 [Helianthus annuus]|nr:hypothetical protein HanIR_Chr02g0092241 [Helianthus annuus]